MSRVCAHWSLVTRPNAEPLELEDLKRHVRVTHSGDDEDLRSKMIAAREWVEAYARRALLTQTLRLTLSGWSSEMWLPMAAPLQSVTSVQYYDGDDVLQTLSSSLYRVLGHTWPASIAPRPTTTLPSLSDRPDAVLVTYVAGWSSAAHVPRMFIEAIKLLAGHWYLNRESVTVGVVSAEMEMGVKNLVSLGGRIQHELVYEAA